MNYIMQPYDDALKYIVTQGVRKSNRTGTDTLSVFGLMTRYRIDEYFPVVTKRKLFPRSIFAELLWMLSGSTNVNDLEKLGSKIWTAWKDPEFEKRNAYMDGELGPVYGWQMRNFGAKYDSVVTYDDRQNDSNVVRYPSRDVGRGFDQVSYLLNELKTNKNSRRILMSYWDPSVVTTDKVKLPPCHYSFQLYVDDKDRLSGMLTQRSGDYFVGCCANVQFYSALIYMLAQQTGLQPYEMVHSVADAHIYVDHLDGVNEYLSRTAPPSPTLQLKKAEDMFSYQLEDFVLENYNPLPVIKVPVAV